MCLLLWLPHRQVIFLFPHLGVQSPGKFQGIDHNTHLKLTDEKMSQPVDSKTIHGSKRGMVRGFRILTLMFVVEQIVTPMTDSPDFRQKST